jgi:thiamine-phosphate pyrophosphorylase
MAPPLCRLYLITPPRLDDLAAFGRVLGETLDAGDVAALQIRLKDAPDDIVAAAVDVLGPIATARGVAVILNDRPDLAASLGCDGVHVGQDDMPLAQARKTMGPDAGGADYVAFGAFFPTATKETTARPSPDLLTGWQADMVIPCVAIGGITVGTARELAAAGADFLAVSAGVWSYGGGPATAVQAFNAEIAKGVADRA